MSKKILSMNLQKFADEGGEGQNPTPQNNNQQTPQQQVQQAQGTLFSEDYVKSLRQEAASYRVAKKDLEETVIKTLGLEVDSIDEKVLNTFVSNLKQDKEQILNRANERLLKAEIKNLDGYDVKLVERLIDKSKVKITEDGEIEGLKELVEELEKEFPQIKVNNSKNNSGANPATGADGLTEKQKLIQKYEEAEKKKDFVSMTHYREQIQKLN